MPSQCDHELLYEIYAASASSVFCKRGSINQISAKPKSAPVMRRSSQVLSRRPNIWVKPSQAIGMLKRIKPHQGMPGSRFLLNTKASPPRNIELKIAQHSSHNKTWCPKRKKKSERIWSPIKAIEKTSGLK